MLASYLTSIVATSVVLLANTYNQTFVAVSLDLLLNSQTIGKSNRDIYDRF